MSEQLPKAPNFTFKLNSGAQNNIQDEAVIGKRIIAYLIDVVILAAVGVVLAIVNFFTFFLMSPLLVLIGTVLPFIYHSYLISSPQQATFGQSFMGLKQVDAVSGGRMPWLQAIIQVILFYMTLFMTGGLLLVWCLFDNKGRCLHDILSNTHIVNRAEN